MSVEFDTAQYKFSHGREPRGRGSWAFGVTRNPDVCNDAQVFWTRGSTTYAEAKRLARDEGQRRGVSYWYVLP